MQSRKEHWNRAGRASLPIVILLGGFLVQSAVAQEKQSQQNTGSDKGRIGSADKSDTAQLKISKNEKFGSYLTDGDGRALYLFTADKQGQGKAAAQSNCYDDCAKAWPPLVTKEKPRPAEPAIKENLIATIKRKDGTGQVTYNGWPLYYFIKDKGAGTTTGQDVKGFGGEWYLIPPDGTKVHERKERK